MEKLFVEITVNIQVNEEICLESEELVLVARRSRTISIVRVVETDLLGMCALLTTESIKLMESFDTLDFHAIKDGLVGENENSSLIVGIHYRML